MIALDENVREEQANLVPRASFPLTSGRDSGSIRFEITMGNNRILVIWFTAQSQSPSISCYGACLKWLLPELSFFRPLVKGNEALGTRLGTGGLSIELVEAVRIK